jgi:hypothetical protein
MNGLLNDCAHFHLFFDRFPLLKAAIKTGLTDTAHATHPLDTQAALHQHQFVNLFVDAVSPKLPLLGHQAVILCKAPLKRSASRVMSPKARLSCAFSVWHSRLSQLWSSLHLGTVTTAQHRRGISNRSFFAARLLPLLAKLHAVEIDAELGLLARSFDVDGKLGSRSVFLEVAIGG